jgi:predicted PurR-regulated permease PerM
MATSTRVLKNADNSSPTISPTNWARRRDIPIAILAWAALVALVLWGASHIIRTLLLLIIAALIAYAIAPGVKFFQRFLPRAVAILLMYLLVFAAIAIFIYFVADTAVNQVTSFSRTLGDFLSGNVDSSSPVSRTLMSLGITQQQITSVRTGLLDRAESIAGSALPFVTEFLNSLLDIVVIVVISIYFLIDGERIAQWSRRNMPQSVQANFLLDTLQRVVGGYIRGQLLLAVIVGVLVGGGLTVLQVPYALLLGVLAFFLEFVPILGTLVSGVICTLIALTHGWIIAIIVLAYFIIVHIVEGDIVGPRIVGQAVGLHPIVSIAAIIAGSELFGIWGALFASPIAGVLQALLVALWTHWRETRPDEFAQAKEKVVDAVSGEQDGSASLSSTAKNFSFLSKPGTREGDQPG